VLVSVTAMGEAVGDRVSFGMTIMGDGVGRDVERGVSGVGRGVTSAVGDGPNVGRNVDEGCGDEACVAGVGNRVSVSAMARGRAVACGVLVGRGSSSEN